MNPFYVKATSSPHWYDLKDRARERAGNRCEGEVIVFDRDGRSVCDPDGGGYLKVRCEAVRNLQLHHHHYRTLGHETLGDVKLLCDRCHKVETVLGVSCARCADQVFGDEADAFSFVADHAALQALAIDPGKIIDAVREWVGSYCPYCEHVFTKDD